MSEIIRVRHLNVGTLTNAIGVYALCDLDKIPIYIGLSMDGIKKRVQRHLTSARSDVIANRQLDVWEVSEVWAWPLPGATEQQVTELETWLINKYNTINPLVNGVIPDKPSTRPTVPTKVVITLMDEPERESRREASRRLPRQLDHLTDLFSHILEVKNNKEQRRMLRVHFNRVKKHYIDFMTNYGETQF